MRETNNGSVPAECFGPSVARRVRPLLRLQNHVAGQVFLEGSEAILQRGFLQVSLQSLLLTTFASCRELRRGLKRRKNHAVRVWRIWRGMMTFEYERYFEIDYYFRVNVFVFEIEQLS